MPEEGFSNGANGTRERALASTERLVAVRGFGGVRLRDVSKDAGVSIGSLQHYFETRDSLLRETFLWSAGRRVREWAAAAECGSDPWERLVALLERALQERDFRPRSTIWIEFCAAAARDEEIRAVLVQVYDAWRVPLRQVVEDGIAAGMFDPLLPVGDIVDTLVMLIDGSEVAALVAPPGMTVPHMRALILGTARLALQVGGPRAAGSPG